MRYFIIGRGAGAKVLLSVMLNQYRSAKELLSLSFSRHPPRAVVCKFKFVLVVFQFVLVVFKFVAIRATRKTARWGRYLPKITHNRQTNPPA